MKHILLDLPEYQANQPPDHLAIGRKIDDVLRQHFMGKTIVLRGIASSEHPGKTTEQLIEIIEQTGTDHYDPLRKGDRYENVEGKPIDLFGTLARVTPTTKIADTIIYGFYHSAIGVHGRPMRIDVLTVYDASKLTQVPHRYEGRDDIKDDGFAFKNPDKKAEALLGVIQAK
jgi:hypothetical protein